MAEKPCGMRLKFVLSQLRTCTHESKNRFVFFKSLKFYCEQESVKSNPVKLNGVSFNLVPRSHSGRGRSGYEIRGRLKRALYAPINVNPVGGSAGKGWGFDKF